MFSLREWTLFPQTLGREKGLYLLPAGALFRPDGSLLLEGEGAPLLEKTFPHLGKRLGQKVKELPKPYGLAVVSGPGVRLGVFQTSMGSLREKGSPVLLAYSLALLEALLRESAEERAHLFLRFPEEALPLDEAVGVAQRVLWGVASQVVLYV